MRKNITAWLLVTVLAQQLAAQGFYNEGAVVSITSQTMLTIPDSLVNKGTLVNDGDLTISGSWINEGNYEAGTGQITFNNEQNQVINHNDQSIGNLVISGGGVKEFLANISILSHLQLQDGILVSGNDAKIIFHEGAAITGGNDHSFIRGPVEHRGTGNWLFPIGNESQYLPVVITNITDPSAAATLLLHESTAHSFNAPDFDRLSENRYWQFDVASGDFGQSQIILPLRDEESLANNSTLVEVAASNTLNGPYTTLGQSEFTGTLTHGSVTSARSPMFSYFTVGAIQSDHAIEVFNAVSPNDDSQNDFMRIENIEHYPNNHVSIFNRWGDKVFETTGYHNDINSFKGASNITGKMLPAGTYFYVIDLNDGSSRKTGFVAVK